MMRRWMTVVSWQDGIATLSAERHSGCNGCQHKGACSSHIFNEWLGDAGYQLRVAIDQAVIPGQRIEIGLAENSLLRAALLVYLPPLAGAILMAALVQWWLNSDIAAFLGVFFGGAVGFWMTRFFILSFNADRAYAPVILQIGLPSSVLRLQED